MKVYGALEVAQLEWFLDSAKPAASSYIYRVIYVSDLKQIMVSDGTNWIPYLNTSTNQTINGNITMNGSLTQENGAILKEIATPSTPSSGYGRVYFKSDGKLYQLNDSGIETQVGTGSGGINYIANGGAEDNNTTGWATYADAAGSSPVDGTGGTANVTISTTATTPLIGTYSFLMAKDAANRQGQGWSYAFTIDSAYRAKVLQISFQYLVNTGTFAAGTSTTDSDVTVWIYDVTNGVVIQPSSYKLLSNSTSITDTFNATFQTASNSSSYRLIFHVSTTSASAYTLEVDGITVSPSTYVYGTPVTDWASYTPTLTGFGTATNVQFQWRRVGDNVEVRGKFTSGTPTATEARATLPLVTSADTGKIPSLQLVGMAAASGTASNSRTVLIEPSVGYVTFGITTSGPLTKANGSSVVAASETISFFALVPVQGWSSSVQTSDQTDTRVVAARLIRSTTQSVSTTAQTKVTFDTVSFDTHSGFNLANNRYIVPVSGYYRVTGATYASGIASNYLQVILKKSGTTFSESFQNSNASNDASAISSDIVFCNASDFLELFVSSGDSSYTIQNASSATYLSIERISGPSAIAASESVNARYNTAAGQTINGASANNTINYGTKVYDSHNAVTTGASWKFTAPISGKYSVKAYNATNNATYAANDRSYMEIWKNGVIDHNLAFLRHFSTTTNFSVYGTTTIQLNAGEYIHINYVTNPNNSLQTSADLNWIAIERVGN
jgi:hypothetical protein